MAEITTPDAARRFVAYWAQEGAEWIKAYTDIRRAELKAAIDEAHKRGMKVTGHLCSVSFREAVALGIDNLEHGLLTATDFDPDEAAGRLPVEQRRARRRREHDERHRTVGHRRDGREERPDDVDARRVRAVRPESPDEG